ncbi:MAG: CDGSH iron-sulfur domain-containing protein [Actinomycetota bacterium]|nr:CDGSH iron-sulfur domain-containing protein [Actinomycetota bacterium]
MTECVINVTDNGPYHVPGPVTVLDAEGNAFPVEAGADVWLCRCGQSGTKPFCDGTHRAVGFAAANRAPRPDAAPCGE